MCQSLPGECGERRRHTSSGTNWVARLRGRANIARAGIFRRLACLIPAVLNAGVARPGGVIIPHNVSPDVLADVEESGPLFQIADGSGLPRLAQLLVAKKAAIFDIGLGFADEFFGIRSEEHTYELPSLMPIS